ncbi:MAG: penicillin-binding transpeptidase domain-containing protein [Candidatus Neptunochlamydia sp.]|nr:penicillin-binding transpeptidase domain-containing protein [Candidatus Neptunochlamydia sp.]
MISRRDVPHKANNVLHMILVAFLMIALRVWYLGAVKHDEYLEKAMRPQRRTVVEAAPRGTVRDRFNLPLAINKMQYNAAVCFDRIREIPVVSWERDERGKKIRIYERRLYVEKLSKVLGAALEMDPIAIEDLIYSKASIFPNTPFILKEDISEKLYYRLRLMEKDWTGLSMQRAAKRYYPQGKVGSDIIGYMGAINERQYLAIAEEIKELSLFLEQREEGLPIPLPKGYYSSHDVELRLKELKEKAYTIHAHVGKSGIERKFDEALRGMYGKHQVEIGAKGRFIRDLPGGKEAEPGDRILLTISLELQAYAEELLVLNERDREHHFPLAGKGYDTIHSPWIKGGSIVAMIPETGEIVAMASYPRFDPNDFILTDKNRSEKIEGIRKWLESSRHIGAIWNGFTPMERELETYIEKENLSWDSYLDQVLSLNCQVRKNLRKLPSVYHAVHLQHVMGALQKVLENATISETIDVLYPETKKEEAEEPFLVKEMRKEIDPILKSIKSNKDKLLFLDLLRLLAPGDLFSDHTLEEAKGLSPAKYRELSQAFVKVKKEVKQRVENLYRERIFPRWRKKHFKAYLKEKREEEKERKTYAHPYTDYLEEGEKKLFAEFWKEHEWKFFDVFIYGNVATDLELQPFLFHLIVTSKEVEGSLKEALVWVREQKPSLDLLATIRSFEELTDPLWGYYYSLRHLTLKGLAGAFYPRNGYGYGKSFAYGRATPIGSLFKVVTGYEALKQKYLLHQDHHLPLYDLSPLEIIDEINPKAVTDNGIVLGRYLDGTFITRHHKGGRMPRSHASLGKVDFRTAMERSSNIYFSLLAGEVIEHPSDLRKTTLRFGFGKPTGIDLYGEISGYVPDDIRHNQTGLYAFAIGQHSLVVTPLQSVSMLATIGNGGAVLKPQIVKMQANASGVTEQTREVKRYLEMPSRVRTELMEGMKRVVMGEKGPLQPYRIRTLYEHPKWIPDYKAIQSQFIGKTSTAEFLYRPFLDRERTPLMCKDIWFGGLSFKEGDDYRIDMPDLSVVVYLKFGDYGKEAAPLAALMIKKWREIQSKNYIDSQ